MAMLTAVTDTLPDTADTPAVDDERALVGSAVRGDVQAFGALYRRHAGRVRGVIVRDTSSGAWHHVLRGRAG